MKIKVENWCNKQFEGKQISFLPRFDFFWNHAEKTEFIHCISFGWLNIDIQIWF